MTTRTPQTIQLAGYLRAPMIQSMGPVWSYLQNDAAGRIWAMQLIDHTLRLMAKQQDLDLAEVIIMVDSDEKTQLTDPLICRVTVIGHQTQYNPLEIELMPGRPYEEV